jgi:hypothetical protein
MYPTGKYFRKAELKDRLGRKINDEKKKSDYDFYKI